MNQSYNNNNMVLNFKFWFDYAIALFLSYSVLLPRSRYLYVFMVKVNQGIIIQVGTNHSIVLGTK